MAAAKAKPVKVIRRHRNAKSRDNALKWANFWRSQGYRVVYKAL